MGGNGFYFEQLDRRHQKRFRQLVREHTHAVNAAVTGLPALPSTAKPFASVLAMSRFLTHEETTLPALIEPAHEVARPTVARSAAAVTLLVHDWCMFNFTSHSRKRDRYQRSHAADLGYELGTALLVDAADGRPWGRWSSGSAPPTGCSRPGPPGPPVRPVTSTSCVT